MKVKRDHEATSKERKTTKRKINNTGQVFTYTLFFRPLRHKFKSRVGKFSWTDCFYWQRLRRISLLGRTLIARGEGGHRVCVTPLPFVLKSNDSNTNHRKSHGLPPPKKKKKKKEKNFGERRLSSFKKKEPPLLANIMGYHLIDLVTRINWKGMKSLRRCRRSAIARNKKNKNNRQFNHLIDINMLLKDNFKQLQYDSDIFRPETSETLSNSTLLDSGGCRL